MVRETADQMPLSSDQKHGFSLTGADGRDRALLFDYSEPTTSNFTTHRVLRSIIFMSRNCSKMLRSSYLTVSSVSHHSPQFRHSRGMRTFTLRSLSKFAAISDPHFWHIINILLMLLTEISVRLSFDTMFIPPCRL